MTWVKESWAEKMKVLASGMNNIEQGISEAKAVSGAVPTGGATGEALVKSSGTNYATTWAKRVTEAEAQTIATEAARKTEAESAFVVATSEVSAGTVTGGGEPTIDSEACPEGKVVLLTAQLSGVQNGLWEVKKTGTGWKRTTGFASGSEQFGVFVPVVSGFVQSGTIWVLSNKTTVKVDTTAQTWAVNAASGGTVAAKELVHNYGKQTAGAGEGALELFSTYSFAEQQVHANNTAFGWNALHNLTGRAKSNQTLTAETAIGSAVLNFTAALTEFAHLLEKPGAHSLSNTPCIVFTTLPGGSTTFKTGVAYYLVNVETNTFELATSKKETGGIKAEGAALTAANTVFQFLWSTEDNTAVGSQAGASLTLGGGNCLYGENAGWKLTTGEENVIIGCEAGSGGTTYHNNVMIGFRACWEMETSEATVCIGALSMEKMKTGAYNTTLGTRALEKNTAGSHNVAIGPNTLQKATGEANTAIGGETAKAIVAGNNNLFIGLYSADALPEGSGNIFIGHESGKQFSTATSNKLVIQNNGSTPIIQGVMSSTAASNELGLGTTGGKIGFCAKAATPVAIKTAGTTAAEAWALLKELGLAL